MPSVSKKQHTLMAMVANDPAAAKRLGIPQKVGKEFMKADKGRKFAGGGEMKNCGTKKGYAKGGLAMRGEGIAKKGFAKGGQVTASGADTAGPQGKAISQPVKKSVTGENVKVRGVGAARARVATIY